MDERMKRLGWAAWTALALLSGCKPAKVPATNDPAEATHAVSAAEHAVAADIPNAGTAQFRGVQSYDQALPDHRAVCGQVSPYPDDQALFVPFVAVMARDKQGGWISAQDARFVGTSVADADRTYLAIVAYCYDKGGPSDGPLQSVAPLPPVPNQIPRPAAPAMQPPIPPTGSAPGSAPGAAPAPGTIAGATPSATPSASPIGGTVTLRQNANLHAAPQGASTRIVPQGTALRVFATAPGGWMEVGDDAPWGWVHESMLDGAAR